MAMQPTVTETNKTWESGKLKLTLTRKSVTTTIGGERTPAKTETRTETVIQIVNKDSLTRDGSGFMWKGQFEDFRAMAVSMSNLFVAVDRELDEDRGDSKQGCSCPIAHDPHCTG